MSMEADCVWPVGAELGEGPVWCAREGALWFTDIKGRRLHRFDPATAEKSSVAAPGRPGFIYPARHGGFVVGMDRRLCRFDGSGFGATIADIDMDPRNRLNDGAVDSAGRLWFGSMDDGERAPTGVVYLFDGAAVKEAGGACVITNGPAIAADCRTLYHVDTAARIVWRFSVGETGVLEDGEAFIEIADEGAYPDGIVLDAENCLWLALWGGWGVRRYSPDGRLLSTVKLPCANVTKVAFGGDSLCTAYVTTARVGLSALQLKDQPLAGGLFAFDAGVRGVASPEVALASP